MKKLTLLKSKSKHTLDFNAECAAGFTSTSGGSTVWRANVRPDVAKHQLRRLVSSVACSFQFAVDDESESDDFQLGFKWLSDRLVRVTFLFGRSPALDMRVVEASTSVDLRDDTHSAARVAAQMLSELASQLRALDLLQLSWQQERAARDVRRTNDARLRPQLPVAELTDANARQRALVINELFGTEVDLIEDLSLILLKFKAPLIEQQLLTDERAGELFGNLDVIYELHLAFLSSLQACVVGGGQSDALARCFLSFLSGGALAHFSVYAVHLPVADALIASSFASFRNAGRIVKFLANPALVAQSDGLTLSALLVKPIQRICKYTLLLNNVVRHTPTSDPAHNKLRDAALLLEDFVQRVNARKLSAESREALQRVAKQIGCSESAALEGEFSKALDNGSAELLFDGAVEMLLPTEGEKEPRSRPMHVYCLNTALLLCEPNARARAALAMSPRSQPAMKLTAVLLWQASLVLDVRSIGAHAFCFALHHSAHVWRLSAATASLKARFLDVMMAQTALHSSTELVASDSATSMSAMLSDIHEDDAFAIDLNDVLHAHDVAPNELFLDAPASLAAPPLLAAPAAPASKMPPLPTSRPPPHRTPPKPKSAPPTSLTKSAEIEPPPTAAPLSIDDEAEMWKTRFDAVRRRAIVVERRYAQRISHLEANQQQRIQIEDLREQLAAAETRATAAEKRERELATLVQQLRDDLSRLSAPSIDDREPQPDDDVEQQLHTARSDLRRLEATLAAKAQQFFESFALIEAENNALRTRIAELERERAPVKSEEDAV